MKGIDIKKWYHKYRNDLKCYLLLLVPICLFSVFFVYGFVRGFVFSLLNYDLRFVMLEGLQFVGFEHYAEVFRDKDFLNGLLHTTIWTVVMLIGNNGFGLLMAVCLMKLSRGRKFFLAGLYWPALVSAAITTQITLYVFNPTETGILNSFLSVFGIPPKDWLVNSLYKKDDYLDVQAKILYSEPQSYLKMPLYTSLKNTSAAFETPFGFIRKPASGCEQPALRFAAIEGDNGAAAFVCENKCSFSADGSKLSFVAVRNNVCANHFGTLTDDDYDYTDEGLHKFRFTVVPFGGKADCAKLTRIAECSGEPDYLLDTYHHGPLPRTASRIECRSENISVTACKRGEDGGVVLRAYETAQKPTDATIVYDGQKITAHFAPNSVHTFLLTEDGVKETDFIERIKQNP